MHSVSKREQAHQSGFVEPPYHKPNLLGNARISTAGYRVEGFDRHQTQG